ncbi:hypothetical protein BDP55DRAFT_655654 [Colletotrichum godetiae]|uniref:Uncharacterized protein n=1 Tax=Colletotrichum godetiae TaxID=1209918 RepID=A0AAJ0ARB8_9PEZI|nr:uncharacterized protein BDP55DRAFT_655654 [Colletotrichum godetiae]KAK1688949.1 hypothetical protein BDP55DRAFT_655654 [Colletotrichum godetiae]
MQISSNVGDGMTDSFCVEGIVGLFVISLVFFSMLAMSTCIEDPLITISDAFYFPILFLGVWWACGIGSRWMMENRRAYIRARRQLWG